MAMGPGPHRPLLKPSPGPHPGHPGLDRGCGADPRRLRHAESGAEHDPRRRASVRAALRRRFADRDRYGRTRGLAHDGGPRSVGDPAVAAFLGSAAAVAPVRLAGPRPCRRGQHAGSGARAMTADLPVSIADIRKAEAAIAGTLTRTPLVRAAELSDLSGYEAYLKLETLQTTGSFKERGALNKLLTLGKAERKAGVVAMSAGNHAQGVAYHARRLGIPATIVMPEGTPFIKIDRTEAYGATVLLKGNSLAAARQAADALARDEGLALVHPYDDPAVIAGQGTIALELLADQPNLDTIFVPIGGGGLISGIAVAAKALKPEIEIIGVQSTLYPSMYRLMRGEDPGPPAAAATLAEGIAVKEPGQLTR